jgi:hypothetical protein
MAQESVKGTGQLISPGSAQRERRISRRCKITQVLRARPSDPELEHFEDIRGTFSVSRSGVYYHSILRNYTVGLRLFVSLPYSHEPTVISREYLAEVVRVDPQPSGKVGVGLKLLMEIGFRESFVESSVPPRR